MGRVKKEPAPQRVAYRVVQGPNDKYDKVVIPKGKWGLFRVGAAAGSDTFLEMFASEQEAERQAKARLAADARAAGPQPTLLDPVEDEA